MAADDFNIMPTWVQPFAPDYPNVITESENYKKDYQNLSDAPVKRYKLIFNGLSDANFETLYDHFYSRYAGYDDFAWKSTAIPTYINSVFDLGGGDLAGRWVEGTFKFSVKANHWDAEVVFEVSL